jgi:hypothetical protein
MMPPFHLQRGVARPVDQYYHCLIRDMHKIVDMTKSIYGSYFCRKLQLCPRVLLVGCV